MDFLFTAVEVEHALSRPKRKVVSPEGLMAEHLQEAGGDVQVWLRKVLNAMVKLEEIPSAMKSGNIIAVYKGSCRNSGNYCGVSLCTVLMKILEVLMMDQMRCTHFRELAYRTSTSLRITIGIGYPVLMSSSLPKKHSEVPKVREGSSFVSV